MPGAFLSNYSRPYVEGHVYAGRPRTRNPRAPLGTANAFVWYVYASVSGPVVPCTDCSVISRNTHTYMDAGRRHNVIEGAIFFIAYTGPDKLRKACILL